MKISELIKRLEQAIETYGDIDVMADYEPIGTIGTCMDFVTHTKYVNIKQEDEE